MIGGRGKTQNEQKKKTYSKLKDEEGETGKFVERQIKQFAYSETRHATFYCIHTVIEVI